MIPKIIHYCWFGGAEKPELVKKCIESWKKFCPGWEIYEWSEKNYDVEKTKFLNYAYKNKAWAFVSDYARLDVVYRYGGVYFDSDVELLKPIEDMLGDDAFFVFESVRDVNTGCGFGASKENFLVHQMMQVYEDENISVQNEKLDLVSCTVLNTRTLVENCPNFRRDGKTQTFEGIKIYSSSEYYSRAKHYFMASWCDKRKWRHIKYFFRKPRFLNFWERRGEKVFNVYCWFAFDLFEYGLWHYVKKMFKKRK